MKNIAVIVISIFLFFSCKDSKHEKSPVQITADYNLSKAPFYHGVASGDPLQDRVIIWTKATPKYHKSVNIEWKVSDKPDMSNALYDGQEMTDSSSNYIIKMDVTDLDPGKEYYYQFEALGKKSPIGKTKTLPTGDIDEFSLAVASCSNYEWGYFNAYQKLAEQDVDLVIHLGDYIYEYGPSTYGDTTIGRINYPAKEIITKEDYRDRYSQYRLDDDLQQVHQQHPFICIWDDHEVSNNVYKDGAENHQDDEGDFHKRKAIAKEVYYEWIPIREDEAGKHYRSFNLGNLASLLMLDERLEGRTEPAPDYESISDDSKMLGEKQLSWLKDQLSNSKTQWKIIGNQVIFSDLDVGIMYRNSKVNLDAWDGYPSEKAEIIEFIDHEKINNTVFLTGDTHCSWAFEVKNSSDKNVALEIGAPSISSANYDEYTTVDTAMMAERGLMMTNEHIKYVDIRNHGYTLLHLTPHEGRAEWHFVDNLRSRESTLIEGKKMSFFDNEYIGQQED